MSAKNRRRVIAVVLFVGFIPVALFVGAFLYPTFDRWRHFQDFEPTEWRAAGHDLSTAWPTRLRMVDHLTTRHRLVGRGGDDLVALLGKPDDIEAFRERSRRTDDVTWDIGYELGPERGPIIRIDNDWLLFDLDANGRVQRWLVTHD